MSVEIFLVSCSRLLPAAQLSEKSLRVVGNEMAQYAGRHTTSIVSALTISLLHQSQYITPCTVHCVYLVSDLHWEVRDRLHVRCNSIILQGHVLSPIRMSIAINKSVFSIVPQLST